ncbi:MAG: NAD(P)-dependent oxidoreductase [Nitrososphaerota archaeon]|nr:NAD(P)-dependent oxidoreductase [Nitrososphaerota archaeon]MDG7034513.1 NAD(P)-dependent oxidoreductase [Nitrososphaerota archaeon]
MGNFLVTGGTGQIGGFLCEELVNAGHRVVCYDSKPNLENIGRIADRVTVEAADVTDTSDLLQVMKRNSIDHVVHLAAMVLLDSMKRPAKAYQVNIMGTNCVLEAARVMDVKKVVFASSVSVYGSLATRRPGIADEEDIPNPPPEPYSTTKIATELMGRYYRESYGMEVNCMRITAAWGPGRYWGYTGQFNDFIRKAAVGAEAAFPADFSYKGEKLRWMYVRDVGYCFAFVSGIPKTGGYLYNLGVDAPFNHRDVLQALGEVVPGGRFEAKELDSPTKVSAAIAGPNGLDVDCTKLHRELGFRPRFGLKAAVADMVAFERARAGIGRQ